MMGIKGVWHYVMIEPVKWLYYALFQPARFRRELEPAMRQQRVISMLRLMLPLFLVSFPLALLGRALLLPFHLLAHPDVARFMVEMMIGILLGMMLGIVAGSVVDSIGSILLGLVTGGVGGVLAGIVVSIGSAFVGSIIFGLVIGSIADIVGSTVFGIVVNPKVGIVISVVGDIVFGVVFGIVFGSLFNVGGMMVGLVVGGIGGIGASIGSIVGYYRILLFPVSGISAFKAYLSSRERPQEVFTFLQHSSVHSDERVYLPLPYLKRTLLIAYSEEPDRALAEIAFIAAERPQQLHAARAAALEIALHDLETRTTLAEIAGAAQRLNEILPQEAKLIDPQWVTPLARLSDASRDAMRFTMPIGRQARSKALEDMIANLRKIHPNVAFRNEQLNKRLGQVVEAWLDIARHEQERFKHAAQDIGKIDNPYKPGQVLAAHDPLFVGRDDLAQQLEYHLNKGSHRPTLLLNGERRMGKSSALLQLPYLLGSTYVPVFYNLQDPGIYARTTTFLGTLAGNISHEMSTRGIPVEQLAYTRLQELGQISDPSAYDVFDRWLANVETALEREDRILLLAFDEFEKLDEAGQAGDLNLRLLLDWYRKTIQYHPSIALLFSGLHTFSEMGSKTGMNWSGYFVNVQTLRISFLNPDEARHLITQPKPDYPGETIFDRQVVDQIMYETNYHPFLVQAICSELIDLLNTEKREQAELSDVKHAVKQVLEAWNSYFDDLWSRTDDDQRACLIALQAREAVDLQHIQHQSGLDEKSVRRTLQTLLKRDLIKRNEDNSYCIAAPIFSEWVERNSYNERDLLLS